MYRRNYSFRINIMEEICEIGSCIEIWAKSTQLTSVCFTVNKELQQHHGNKSDCHNITLVQCLKG